MINNSFDWEETAVESVVPVITHIPATGRSKPFIEANTIEVELTHLQQDCIIPVFSKDNERTISHQEFIDTALLVVQEVFGTGLLYKPEVRVSHTIKGRVPEAIHKSVKDLLEHEKTVYYERMAFAIEIPNVTDVVSGNELTLTMGGVRSYNHENLYSKKTTEQFKVFIGFKNMVCCNMCVSSDGFVDSLRASTTSELKQKMLEFVQGYTPQLHLQNMQDLTRLSLTESQFAQVLGKCRLHQYLPKHHKQDIPLLEFTDTQIHTVAKDYFVDENFARAEDGTISLWKMYNLLTGANKNSYIDQFLTRGVNAYEVVTGISEALQNPRSPYTWFLK